MEEDKKEVFKLYKLLNYKSTILRNKLIVAILFGGIIIVPLLTHILFGINLLTLFVAISIIVSYVSIPNTYKIVEWRSSNVDIMGNNFKLRKFNYGNMTFYHTELHKDLNSIDLYDMNYDFIDSVNYYHYSTHYSNIKEKFEKIIDDIVWKSFSNEIHRMKDGRKILIMYKGHLDKYYISYLKYENYYSEIITEETSDHNKIKYCKNTMNMVVDDVYLLKGIKPDGTHRTYWNDITICWYNTTRIRFNIKDRKIMCD